MVPGAMVQLDEADPALGEAPGHETVRSERPALFRIWPIELERALGLFRQIGQFGYRGLHPERHFVLRDPCVDLGVLHPFEFVLVQFHQVLDERRTLFAVEALRVGDGQHRVAHGPQFDTLILARKKSRAPLPLGDGSAVAGNHDDKGGEVPVEAAQSVGGPRSKARPARQLKPRLGKRQRGIVIDLPGMHRLDKAQVVRHLGSVRQQVTEPGSRLPVLRERKDRGSNRKGRLSSGHGGQALSAADRLWQLGALPFHELRLVIVQVDL